MQRLFLQWNGQARGCLVGRWPDGEEDRIVSSAELRDIVLWVLAGRYASAAESLDLVRPQGVALH